MNMAVLKDVIQSVNTFFDGNLKDLLLFLSRSLSLSHTTGVQKTKQGGQGRFLSSSGQAT
jgi:hypothetical protein